MGYSDGFGVDDLVNHKTKLVNKIAVINGRLTKFEMGPGLFVWPLKLTIEGKQWRIVAGCKISRFQGEHWKLQPYLNAYLGETIGVKVFANDYTITAMKFGETEFTLNER